MFGSSLPPVVDRRAHVLLMIFVFIEIYCCPTRLNNKVTWWMSYKKQKWLALHGHIGSSPLFGGPGSANLFSVLFFVCMCVLVFFFSFSFCLFVCFFICSVFLLCFCLHCVSCAQYCLCLRLVYSGLLLRFSLSFIYFPTKDSVLNI